MDHRSTKYSISHIFIIFLIFILLYTSTDYAISKENMDPDFFNYIGINKDVQITHQYCIFKCVISPIYNISIVQLKLIYSNNSSSQYPMQYVKEGFYSYSIIFEKVGKNEFQIIAYYNDTETFESSIYPFWITTSYNDKDSDGIDDWWENKYGLNPENPHDAHKDLDNDGYTNKQEFIRNTHPLRDNVFENAWVELSNNCSYFFLSFLFLLLLSWLSLCGIKKVHS